VKNLFSSLQQSIGVFLPIKKITEGIKKTSKKLASGEKASTDCAEGILTTDTFTKEITVEIEIQNTPVKIAGVSKGSGMIHPNMATMLGFLTTDVCISQELLDKAFKENIDDSFNMITVDGETSTNDMAVILANGMAENPGITKEDDDYKKFKNALEFVCKYLAKQMSKRRGATKFIETKISEQNQKRGKSLVQSHFEL
jgi:glutamate N-acetyltransferase/amino-acid N-acetyltransferase